MRRIAALRLASCARNDSATQVDRSRSGDVRALTNSERFLTRIRGAAARRHLGLTGSYMWTMPATSWPRTTPFGYFGLWTLT